MYSRLLSALILFCSSASFATPVSQDELKDIKEVVYYSLRDSKIECTGIGKNSPVKPPLLETIWIPIRNAANAEVKLDENTIKFNTSFSDSKMKTIVTIKTAADRTTISSIEYTALKCDIKITNKGTLFKPNLVKDETCTDTNQTAVCK